MGNRHSTAVIVGIPLMDVASASRRERDNHGGRLLANELNDGDDIHYCGLATKPKNEDADGDRE